MGPREELEESVQPKVEVWAHRVCIPAKMAKRYPQLAHSGLGLLLQLEWQYLQRTVHEVGSMMSTIDDALREAFFPKIFRGEEVSADLREILVHSVKHRGLGIPDPQLLAERMYNTSKAAIKVLLVSLLRGTGLNYVAHKGCVCRSSADRRKQQEIS